MRKIVYPHLAMYYGTCRPLPPRKVASPNRANYCSIAILHLFQKNLKLGRLPPKIAVGQLWAKEMG